MNHKVVRLKFVDVYPGFVPEASAVCRITTQKYDSQLYDDSDYIITQSYGCWSLAFV